MVVLLEDLTETILIENGVTPLLGIDFITEDLKITWGDMERIFVKSASEYGRSKPKEDELYIASGTSAILPENLITVKAVRYGVLMELPRLMFDKFEEEGLQWNPHTRELKVFPPIASIRISYARTLHVNNNFLVKDKFITVDGEDELEGMLRGTFRSGTLTVTKNTKTMSVTSKDSETATLSGDLGTGSIDLKTRKFALSLSDTSAGQTIISYYPKYKAIVDYDMEIGDKVFSKLYAYNLLNAVSAVRAQATQEPLHNIDLTNDDLQARVAALGAEVRQLLKSSLNFSALINE